MALPRLLAFLLVFAVGSLSIARAGEPVTAADRERALAAVKQGNAWLDAHEPERALAAFREAYALVPSSKLHYNFGQAYRAMPGREVEAFESFSTFLAEAPDASVDTRRAAHAAVEALRAKVGLLVVTSEPAPADVEVDGQVRGKTSSSRPIALLPGEHAVRLTRSGSVPSDRVTLSVAAGETVTRHLVLAPVAPVVERAPPPLTAPPAPVVVPAAPERPEVVPPRSPFWATWWFWTGVAVVAAGTTAFLMTRDPGRSCPPSDVCVSGP